MTKSEKFLLRLSDDLRNFAENYIPNDADTCMLISSVLQKVASVFVEEYKEDAYEEK